MSQATISSDQALVIKRTFAAPVEKVYQAWVDPARLAQWFSSNARWNAPLIDIDPAPGGRHNITMRHSDGDEFHIVGRYVEIVVNQRLVFTWIWRESEVPDHETLVTVEFRAVPGGTELTLAHERLLPQDRQGTAGGWDGCFEMLDSYLQGRPLLGVR